MFSQSMDNQNPFSYTSLKSISILSSHIHTGLLNGLFPSCLPIINLFNITFSPMHATFLYHLPMFFIILVSDKQNKLWNSTLCIHFFLFTLSLFQTLSWLLYIIVHWTSVSPCIRIWVLVLDDTYWQYTVYPETRYFICFLCMWSWWISCCHRCLYTQPRKYQQLWTYNRKSSLLQCAVITAIFTCAC
jgi:hypothetical protein